MAINQYYCNTVIRYRRFTADFPRADCEGSEIESPYVDHAVAGPDTVFPEPDVDNIVTILNTVRANAAPDDEVALA